MNYEHEYVEYDELSSTIGPKCIRCQCCGKKVVDRHYIEINIKSDPPRTEKVLTLVKLGNYRRLPVALSNGTYINLHMCGGCSKREIIDQKKDKKKCAAIMRQIRNSFKNEDTFSMKHPDDVKKNDQRWEQVNVLKSFETGLSQDQIAHKLKSVLEEHREKEIKESK